MHTVDFTSVRELCDHLRAETARLSDQLTWAFIRAAWFDKRFVTARVLMLHETRMPQKSLDYGRLQLREEHWPAAEIADRLEKILAGSARIADLEVDRTFIHSHRSDELRADTSVGGWSATSYESFGEQEKMPLYVPSVPALAAGLKPYETVIAAINEWVHWRTADSGGRSLHQDNIVTVIPDYRARIVSAQWLPDKLVVEVSAEKGADLELQVILRGSSKEWARRGVQKGPAEIQVPTDTTSVGLYVVDGAGACVTHVFLGALYDSFGAASKELQSLHQSRIDLAAGENERIEYKPFIVQGDAKEQEVVHTAIAFANTVGGRLYIGVRKENGVPEGKASLQRLWKQSPERAIKALASHIRALITDRISPIPQYLVEEQTISGEPILVVDVKKRRGAMCSTHDNQVFVRKGSTNRRPAVSEISG